MNNFPGFHPGLAAGHPSGIHEFHSLFKDTTPLELNINVIITQGSAGRATLGYGTKPRWGFKRQDPRAPMTPPQLCG